MLPCCVYSSSLLYISDQVKSWTNANIGTRLLCSLRAIIYSRAPHLLWTMDWTRRFRSGKKGGWPMVSMMDGTDGSEIVLFSISRRPLHSVSQTAMRTGILDFNQWTRHPVRSPTAEHSSRHVTCVPSKYQFHTDGTYHIYRHYMHSPSIKMEMLVLRSVVNCTMYLA